MKTPDGYLAATGVLVCATSLMVSSCAAHLAAPAAIGDRSAALGPVRAIAARGQGNLVVSIPWPSLGRSGQFLYGGGSSVAAVEVFLTDSLGNYQSAVIVRNPAAGGNGAGTATVPFANVPAGPVTVSVHTTYNQLLGSVITASPVASTSFIIGGNTVVPVVGDQTTPFVAFRSTDLLGIAANGAPHPFLTTANVYGNARTGANEMTDSSSLTAGYGTGAATASVAAGGTTAVAVTVAQAPVFASGLYTQTSPSTFSAGTPMSLGASIQPGDVLLATDSLLPTTTDVVDLAVNLGSTYSIAASGGNIAFSTTQAFPAKAAQPYAPRNLYLLRGSMVSLVNLAGHAPPKLVVEPGAVSVANSSILGGGGTFAHGATNQIVVQVDDAFGNPVNDMGPLSLANPNATISGTVSPVTFKNASSFLIPGLTYGQVSAAFAPPADMVGKPGQWTATFTQGSVAATTNGATTSIAPVGASNFASLQAAFLPYSLLNATPSVTVGVTGSGTGPFSLTLYPDTSTGSSTPILSGINVAVNGTAPDVANGVITANSPLSDILTLANPLNSGDSGTRFNYNGANIGNRAVGDSDKVTIALSGNANAIGNGVSYTWK